MILATSEEFTVSHDNRPLVSVRWDELVRVRAYKRDDLTTDTICLDVELRDGTRWSLDEEASGWKGFLDMAERALPGMLPFTTWFPRVSQPPFSACELLIFELDAPGSNAT